MPDAIDADALVDGLEREIAEFLLKSMPPDPTGELAQQSLADLLITYGTWTSRLIGKRPRTVHRSREMTASPHVVSHQAEVGALIAKIEAGEDLRPHLSKRVDTAFVPGASGRANNQRADRDLMIADWGIHHLHLASELEPDGRWIRRGRDLLYGVFGIDDAYLLGVFGHGDWALKQLVEIIVRNWPESGVFLKSNFAVGLASPEPSDDERLLLRNAGVVSAFEIDGAVWTPLGQTIAGTPMVATRAANSLMHTLYQFREGLSEILCQYQAEVEQAQQRSLSGGWKPAVIGRLAGFRCDDVFLCVANLDPGEVLA